ncbi:sensor histidine kinase [Hyphococcus flavus]|uniref:histidine kinase n=1 Tax=Hyphococcus flavus TaxID=1866326 RepID=A0AAE9ZA08_9PROT|nr:sensor histidine kinase [Hyphococcus flavus]WDI30154.1 sensor histidine kinase [Hyphococcus flavus]
MRFIHTGQLCHRILVLPAVFIAVLIAACGSVSAADRIVRIDGREPVRNLEGRIYYHLDETRALNVNEIARVDFDVVPTHEPDFQYTKSAIWLKIPVINQQRESVDMRMTLQTNFMTELAIFKVDDERAEILFEQNENSGFATRIIPHPNIVIPITFEPVEGADIYIRYLSRGSTTLPIRFETLPSFERWSQSYTAKLFTFYALMFAFAVMSTIAFVVTPRGLFLAYAFYAIAVILYIGQRDGVAFQYFWPNAPLFNGYASLPLGCLVGLAAAVFARVFLDTKKNYPGADIFLRMFMVLCALIPFSAFFIGESNAKKVATYWVTFGAISFLVIGFRAMKTIQPRIVFYLTGWFGIVFASVLVTARDVMGISPGRSETLDIVRAATLFDATMMGLAMTAAILHIRSERDKSLRDQVEALQSNLALHERLNSLESRYEQAAEEAEKRGRVLANASHDIRQPLFALRSTLKEFETSSATDKGQGQSIERSLDYIEGLVDDFTKTALNEASSEAGIKGPATPVSVIFDAVHGMFLAEAENKGLELVIVPSSRSVRLEAFPMLRVITNLVANAVAYTKSGKVLIGCRRRGDRLLVEVYDTGPGISASELETVMQRNHRGSQNGSNPDGEGLGLAIVREIVDEEGMKFFAKSEPGKGSCFAIEAPLA